MPKSRALEKRKKALTIASNPSIHSVVKLILSDYIKCVFIKSSPDAKQFLKSSNNIRVLVLDWSVQDRHGSIMKCLKAAASRGNILVINVFVSSEQKKSTQELILNLPNNDNIFSVLSDLMQLSLAVTLFRIRKKYSIFKGVKENEKLPSMQF